MKMPGAHPVGLFIGCFLSSTLATAVPLLSALEGSADEEELFNSTASFSTTYLLSELPTTPAGPHVNADALKRVEDFLRENTLLILVTITLVFLILLIICGAFFMSRKQKLNAYYPSSFPSKMYVDHRDKTGGAKPFHEVPEQESLEQINEPMDSHKQLQADIMRAARSLRTPHKTVVGGQREDQSSEETLKPQDGSILDALLPSLPEEEPCQLSLSETAAVSSEENLSEKSDSQETLLCKNARPPSLNIHESATLQLIAGEKTAF